MITLDRGDVRLQQSHAQQTSIDRRIQPDDARTLATVWEEIGAWGIAVGLRAAARCVEQQEPAPQMREILIPGRSTAALVAREWVRRRAEEAGFAAGVAEDARLCASELAANALDHTRSGWIGGSLTVGVAIGQSCLGVMVTDQGRECGAPAVVRQCDLNSERGRGLLIVEGFAEEWGVVPGAHGRTVWAVLGEREDTVMRVYEVACAR